MPNVGQKKPHVGRIDLFKQIGSCRIEASTGEHEVWVESTDPGEKGQMMKLKLKVAAGSPGVENKVSDSAAQVKADISQNAKAYLSHTNIEVLLSDAVKAMLRERPENPRQFVIDHLTQNVAPTPLPPQFEKGDLQLHPAQAQQKVNPKLAPIDSPRAPMDGYDILGLSTPKSSSKDTGKPSPKAAATTEPEATKNKKETAEDSVALAKQRSTTKETAQKQEQKEDKTQNDDRWMAKKELKESARKMLNDGMENGSLQNALKDIRGEAVVKQKEQKDANYFMALKQQDLQVSARDQALKLLTEGMDSGALQEALEDMKPLPPVNQDLERLRSKTKAGLAGAVHAGKLSTAFSSLQFIAGLESCRKKTQQKMLAALQNGKLSSTLQNTKFSS